MSDGKGRVRRIAKPEQTNPASGKTLTVTITAPVRSDRFLESSAFFINEAAKEFVKHLASHIDPDKVTVTVSYDFPQWKRVYEPNEPT